MQHYYSESPKIKSNKGNINYTILDKNIELITDNGVFSKSKVDFGTDLMLRVFLKNNKRMTARPFFYINRCEIHFNFPLYQDL